MPRRFAPRLFLTISQKVKIGGGGGIRTHDALSDIAVFKTAALGLYATPPYFFIISHFSLYPLGCFKNHSLLNASVFSVKFSE